MNVSIIHCVHRRQSHSWFDFVSLYSHPVQYLLRVTRQIYDIWLLKLVMVSSEQV